MLILNIRVSINTPEGAKRKMMINNPYHQDDDEIKRQKLSNPNPDSRQYHAAYQNPRIVRVSQAYGGKDRHSKVWTVKGLRDRRIRLAVPEAIQLYHLQDQLGLSQPSKVIDWLLEVAKEDINKLPPLQMTSEDFNRFHLPPSTFIPQDSNSRQIPISPFFSSSNYDHQRITKGKEAIVENKWNSYNNYYDFQPSSNLSLSRFGHQLESYASVIPSSSLATSAEAQFFSCFTGGSASPSFCTPYLMPHHHFQLSNSIVPAHLNLTDRQVKVPFGLSMNLKVSSLQSINDDG